ncbi:hypothetical protein KCU95_g32, partial [Aureobasidium melanogenum]
LYVPSSGYSVLIVFEPAVPHQSSLSFNLFYFLSARTPATASHGQKSLEKASTTVSAREHLVVSRKVRDHNRLANNASNCSGNFTAAIA